MTRKYNNHHHGQYATADFSRLDRAAIGDSRILCSTVDIAGSKEQPGHKLRCLYGLRKGLPCILQIKKRDAEHDVADATKMT